MATLWGDIADKVRDRLKSALPYAKITIIGGAEEYINNNVAQSVMEEIQVLIAPTEGSSYNPSSQPRLGGYFRKRYEFEILVVTKADPKMVGRLVGPNNQKKPADEILSEVHDALEHSNLGGFVDNKAGSNFENSWVKLPQNEKAITIFTTIYTVIKTER